MAERRWLIFLLGTLTILWLAIVIIWPISFWHSYDEYAYLSLGDASNLEIWLRTGTHYADAGLGMHPGVPFYLISWICLRATALLTGHGDAVAYAWANPDPFFISTRIAAGLVTLIAVVGAWRVLAPLAPNFRVLALASFFAADPWSLIYGLTFLGSETFALPLAALLFWCVRRAASISPEDRTIWAVFGVAAALGYIVKLTYLLVLVGVITLAFAKAATLALPIASKFVWAAKRIAISLSSFLALSVGILLPLLGWNELSVLLTEHSSFVFDTRTRAVSLHTLWANLFNLVCASPIMFMVIGVVSLSAYFVFTRKRSDALSEKTVLWLITSITTLTFVTLAIVNHYQPFYVPAIAALLPFAWTPILERPGMRRVVIVCLAIAAIFSGRATIDTFGEMTKRAAEMQADEQAIMAMPLSKNEARLWTYRTPGQYFVREFVLQFAGLQDYVHQRSSLSAEYSSYAGVVRPYRYVVFDRGYHASADVIRRQAARGELIEPNGFRVSIGNGAVYHEFERTIVVENPGR